MKLRHTLPLITALILAVPATAGAATGSPVTPKIHMPFVGLTRSGKIQLQTAYDLRVGDTATITYVVKRHRTTRGGFKVVGRFTHTVVTGNAFDKATIGFNRLEGGLRLGVGYKVFPHILDTSINVEDTAHPGRITL